ncbi:hypothetical protein ABTN60_18770, partial [Acinetobacter baumannii]
MIWLGSVTVHGVVFAVLARSRFAPSAAAAPAVETARHWIKPGPFCPDTHSLKVLPGVVRSGCSDR